MSLFNNQTKMSIDEATKYLTEEFGIENENINSALWEKFIKNIFANINIENEKHSPEDWYKLYLYRIKDNTMLQILQNQNISNKLDQLLDIETKRLKLEEKMFSSSLPEQTQKTPPKKEIKTLEDYFENLNILEFEELKEHFENLYNKGIIDDDQFDRFDEMISIQEENFERYITERRKVTNTDYQDELSIEANYVESTIQNIIKNIKLNNEVEEDLEM